MEGVSRLTRGKSNIGLLELSTIDPGLHHVSGIEDYWSGDETSEFGEELMELRK
mgnify:CR=1 FL=1